jgi:RNA polymerase sigma-70 factor (ECF subfamily)
MDARMLDPPDTAPMDARRDFETRLQAHRGIVFKVAATYASHPEDRADLAQDIATQLWRAYRSYDPARSFSTWMYRIALNVAISHVRRQAPRHGLEPLDETHAELAGVDGPTHETDEAQRVLARLLASLPPLDRALLLLYLDERPQREIAAVLGIGESNVATKIGRLKQRLRQQLAGDTPSGDSGDTHGTR